MSPANERKLLEAILRHIDKPPARHTLRMTLIGAVVWMAAGFAVVFLSGGYAGITWQLVAVSAIAFALGAFTCWDWYRHSTAISWPVFSPYLDRAAIESRLSQLRT